MTVPAGETVSQIIRADVQYFLSGMPSAATVAATPDPLTVNPAVCYLSLTIEEGWEWLTLYGESGRRYMVQSSTNLVDWTDHAILTPYEGYDELVQPLEGDKAFYRARLLP